MGGVVVVLVPPHTHLMKEDYITMTVIPMKVGCFDEMYSSIKSSASSFSVKM